MTPSIHDLLSTVSAPVLSRQENGANPGVSSPGFEGAAPSAPEHISLDVAETLSPSQVNTFQNCSAQWYFGSVLKLPNPKTGSLARGIAVDEAISANYALKVDSGRDLSDQDVLDEFDASWNRALDITEFHPDESPAKLAQQGRDLVILYMHELAPKIQPLASQLPVEGLVGGVRVRGIIDLIDQDYKVRDTKTAKTTPADISPSHLFQLATYAQLTPRPQLTVACDTLVALKQPKLVTIEKTLTPADFRFTETIYPLVQEQMRSGLISPARSSMFCSRKSCSFWRTCEAEFGGRVKGGEE